jgi:chaperonin GroEL (HSP60 family)
VGLLENGHRGSRFPLISLDFYNGSILAENIRKAIEELHEIKKAVSMHKPSEVIWDIDDRSKSPPWGAEISIEITSMADYFVSSRGRDLFELMFEAFESAADEKVKIEIVEI